MDTNTLRDDKGKKTEDEDAVVAALVTAAHTISQGVHIGTSGPFRVVLLTLTQHEISWSETLKVELAAGGKGELAAGTCHLYHFPKVAFSHNDNGTVCGEAANPASRLGPVPWDTAQRRGRWERRRRHSQRWRQRWQRARAANSREPLEPAAGLCGAPPAAAAAATRDPDVRSSSWLT